MCGIVGYVGKRKAVPILIEGLKRLEYRGYDSAGIATVDAEGLSVTKRQGKVDGLSSALKPSAAKVGIAHTRWATHGEPSERNAHPHVAGTVAVVHNGIIENYAELKAELCRRGRQFASDTDSEVLSHLIDEAMKEGLPLVRAVPKALGQVEGTFGVAIISSIEPAVVIGARRGSPLLLGIADDGMYLASDATAVVGHADKVIYLDDDEMVICRTDSYEIFDFEHQPRLHESHTIVTDVAAIEKGGYDHFLIKEIMEQPQTVTDILRGRLDMDGGTSHLGGLNLLPGSLRRIRRFLSIGCGTAYYAGLLGHYLLERLTGIPTDVEFGSEFRYRDAALSPGTVALIITQSGETADTLASLRELKRRGVHTLGLVNVVGSSVAREVDGGVFLHAGPEISVASTKAFTAQVVAQLLFGLNVARSRDMNLRQGQELVTALSELPAAIEETLKAAPQVAALAKELASFDNAMFLGRDALYPVALEGSHKLKEVSYIYAEAYPAGEMKHGANALIDEKLLVVYLAPQNELYAKSRSNLEEVKARQGRVLAVASVGDKGIDKLANWVIRVPKVSPWIEPLVVNIPLQLLAYYVAVERGTDVDQPRNLAKSVTVE